MRVGCQPKVEGEGAGRGSSPVTDVGAALDRVRERIAAAASRAGREPTDVRLVAVSKTVPVARMREAMAAGQRDFGENRAPEAVAKHAEIGGEVMWHFVGRLQRNKVRSLAGWVDLIHSVDRSELAAEIDRRAVATNRRQDILVEVNLTGDPGRGGVAPQALPELLQSVARLKAVRVTGLMTMAQPGPSEAARPLFRQATRLREAMSRRFPELEIQHLSMGMSQDYEVAVEEGATLVRVGEAIFGPRPGRIQPEEAVGGVGGSASTGRGR